MEQIDLSLAENAIDQIAKREGVSVEHIKTEMKIAMINGLCSNDPKVKSFWDSIPRKDAVPTPEEFIAFTAKIIKDKTLK